MTKLQPGSDIEKKEQELEGKTDGSKSPQHPQDGGCPDCHTKMVWIGELEMRLTDQEEIARQQVEAAVMRQQDLSKLSSRINELEAQQSGQASTLEDPASRPLPPHYYCSDCSWTQKKLYDAKQKNRELEREVERRKQKAYALGYEVDKARDDREVLRQRLDEANIEIARLRAQLGPRTSKL